MMKRKLISALLVSALEFHVASLANAQALAICSTTGTANGATPVTSGPLNPVDGFPEWLMDSNGLTVKRCLDANYCFFDPIVQNDPFSVQIGSGGESFYWQASSRIKSAAGLDLMVDMAAEAAFLSLNPLTKAPINGSQNPFLRFRIFLTAPQPGIYTVIYPYGVETFVIDVASANRIVSKTVDAGFGPNANPVTGAMVGPFLKSVIPQAAPLFIGNMGPTATVLPVSGSPCVDSNNQPINYVKITGKSLVDGSPLDLDGNGGSILESNLFNVQGMISDRKIQTPVSITRQTYSRPAQGTGQVDVFARTTATAAAVVSNSSSTLNPPGTWLMPTATALTSSQLASGGALAFASLPVADTGAGLRMPGTIAVSATDTTTNPTTLISPLVDLVTITTADYDPATRQLLVVANSSDQINRPALTLRNYGPLNQAAIITDAPPGQVTVDSTAGGSDTVLVRVLNGAPPNAVTALVASAVTASTVTLTWKDNSTNETGFVIYRDGVVVARLAANTVTFTDSGLTAATAYLYRVDAVNNAGQTPSTVLSVSTKAILASPGAPLAELSPAGSTRAVLLRWTDNSTDETGFHIERSDAANPTGFTRVTVAPLSPNTTSYADTSAGIGASYIYRIVALRGTETSPSATVLIATPALPAAPAQPIITTAASGLQVILNWSANPNPTFVERKVGTGAFTAISSQLPAGIASFTDTTTASTSYAYRIVAINWAGATVSASTAVTTPAGLNLSAPGNVLFPNPLQANLFWTDNSTGETGYRVQRYVVTVNATTGAVTSSTAPNLNATLASNSVSYADTTTISGQTYIYEIAAINGTQPGPGARSPYIVAGGIGQASALSAQQPRRGFTSVTVQWRLPVQGFNAIGGTRVVRCDVDDITRLVRENTCLPLGTATSTSSSWSVVGRPALVNRNVTYTDTTVALNTSYVYRVTPVGGSGTGISGITATTALLRTR